MANNILIAILQKHGENDYSVWYPEIPSDDPLLVALLEKYQDGGCSNRGNKDDVLEDLKDNL